MSSKALDGLLNDLELACQDERAPSSISSHLSTSTSDRNLSPKIFLDDFQSSRREEKLVSPAKGVGPPVPVRDLSSVMAATAVNNSRVANNLNELDVLLQDLSNARLSNPPSANVVEHKSESFSTSSVSYQTSGFYPSEYNRPLSGERKSPAGVIRTPMEDAMIREMSSKMEKHEFSSSTTSTSEESRWQYIGNGYHEPKKSQVDTLNLATSYHGSSRHKASSATQELDDLMQSLNTFKLKEKQVDIPESTNLDDMLGNLAENMEKQGIKTTQKGICAACDKPIIGQVATALGRTFHPEHFTCAQCNQELGTQNFFEREDKPYCEDCYHNMFSPLCAHCNGAILDKCISALDRTWHPDHFVCFECGNTFGDDGFHEKDDEAYCKGCYYAMFAPKCGKCHVAITENYISSLDAQWHANCFVCATCNQPFADGNFFEHEGAPYCETHFHALKGSLCAGCSKPISGRCITAMFRKFHPEHFVCSFCLKQLNKGTFKEKGEKPYCHECFSRLFG